MHENLSLESFEALNEDCLILFYASWAAPSMVLLKRLEKYEKKKLYLVNMEGPECEIGYRLEIVALPTLIHWRNKKVANIRWGAMTLAEVNEWV
jgi:thioredoxin-like negative regulator of GroEL